MNYFIDNFLVNKINGLIGTNFSKSVPNSNGITFSYNYLPRGMMIYKGEDGDIFLAKGRIKDLDVLSEDKIFYGPDKLVEDLSGDVYMQISHAKNIISMCQGKAVISASDNLMELKELVKKDIKPINQNPAFSHYKFSKLNKQFRLSDSAIKDMLEIINFAERIANEIPEYDLEDADKYLGMDAKTVPEKIFYGNVQSLLKEKVATSGYEDFIKKESIENSPTIGKVKLDSGFYGYVVGKDSVVLTKSNNISNLYEGDESKEEKTNTSDLETYFQYNTGNNEYSMMMYDQKNKTIPVFIRNTGDKKYECYMNWDNSSDSKKTYGIADQIDATNIGEILVKKLRTSTTKKEYELCKKALAQYKELESVLYKKELSEVKKENKLSGLYSMPNIDKDKLKDLSIEELTRIYDQLREKKAGK